MRSAFCRRLRKGLGPSSCPPPWAQSTTTTPPSRLFSMLLGLQMSFWMLFCVFSFWGHLIWVCCSPWRFCYFDYRHIKAVCYFFDNFQSWKRPWHICKTNRLSETSFSNSTRSIAKDPLDGRLLNLQTFIADGFKDVFLPGNSGGTDKSWRLEVFRGHPTVWTLMILLLGSFCVGSLDLFGVFSRFFSPNIQETTTAPSWRLGYDHLSEYALNSLTMAEMQNFTGRRFGWSAGFGGSKSEDLLAQKNAFFLCLMVFFGSRSKKMVGFLMEVYDFRTSN